MAEEKRSVFEAGSFSVSNVSGVRDSKTGVYTGLFGTAPAEGEIAEEQFSVARAAAPVAGFRIYRDSADTDATNPQFSITAGKVNYRGGVTTYAGSTGIALTGGNNVLHYVYLALPAATLTVNTTGWPTTPHVRIATITPASGTWSWSGFTDYRDSQALGAVAEPNGLLYDLQIKTTDFPLTEALVGSLCTNKGATAQVIFTLPTARAGLAFDFYVAAAYALRVTAGTGDTIRNGSSVSASAGYTSCATIGASCRLVAIDDTQWVMMAPANGTWTIT